MYVANHKFIARNFLLWQQQDRYLFWSCLCYQVSKNQSWFIVNCPSCSAAMTPWVCIKHRKMSITAIWLTWRLETKYIYMYTLFYQALVCYLQNDSTGNRRSVKSKSQLFCYQLQGQRKTKMFSLPYKFKFNTCGWAKWLNKLMCIQAKQTAIRQNFVQCTLTTAQ